MKNYRIGVTGYSGRVGQELLSFPNIFPLACDVRNLEEVDLAVKHTEVDIIVHLASISDVDKCEDPQNRKLIDDTNVKGTLHMAQAGEKHGCKVVLLSSSHVFDGKWGNYKEKNKPHPINYYGLSKLGAESFLSVFDNLKIVRTSYLFDYERLFKHVYPLRAGHPYEYPTFIERSFMYLPHFAESLYQYLMRIDEMPDILHIAGCRSVSWYELMLDVAEAFRLQKSLVCPRHRELDNPSAPRPHHAGLNVGLSNKLGLPQYGHLEGIIEMRSSQ